MLSNLDPLITADDCIEIFQNVGPVTKAVIHYNSDGSSQGTGEVQFANKTDALRAAEEYDAAQVDDARCTSK
jgi:RNA recognition motif-containing protein